MKVLWLCNIVLPRIAKEYGLKASNKEGWLSGIYDAVKNNPEFELGICFPVSKEYDGVKTQDGSISCYGFYEDTSHPEIYDSSLEERLQKIVEDFEPEMVHIFGTEFPHTLAMCRCFKHSPEKILVGIQGILEIYKDHFFDGLPDYVVKRKTLRDILKKDSLRQQQAKYAMRAINEVKAVRIAGNLTGRTPFDNAFCVETNPDAQYLFMNETLRPEFYEGKWDYEKCEKHSIFLSQGNYPIKGLHTMLEAASLLKEKYPDLKIYVAGDVITRFESLKDKIKISSYGKYIRELLDRYGLHESVIFTGSLDGRKIKETLLNSNVFVCPSSIENSPNSLGEAMILSVPCIASNVGGISGIFTKDVDGLMFENADAEGLSDCIDKLFSDSALQVSLGANASVHAHKTHNQQVNFERLMEIYKIICG